jgi:hypothetical protein
MNFLLRPFLLGSRLLLVAVVALSLWGCVTSNPDERWKPVVRHNGNQVHIVKWQDETLPAISRWYTGSIDHAETIANANPTLNPAAVQVGDRVFIPQNLLKTKGEMSRSFLDTFLSIPAPAIKDMSGVAVSTTPLIIRPRIHKKKKETVAPMVTVPAVVEKTIDSVQAPSKETASEPDNAALPLFGPR